MKLILLVGLGSFGYRWYQILKRDYANLSVVVVNTNSQAKDKIDGGDHLYTSLKEAIEKEAPDFVLNVTPPEAHSAINNLAFDYRLPVLCEKPISDDYQSALAIVERAEREKIPFMIAENYRYFPFIRRAKKLIDVGAIGDLSTTQLDFRRNFRMDKDYLLKMQDPLLLDVSIHHFDLMRYLTGSEGKRIYAKNYNAPGSWLKNNTTATLILDMENGLMISFHGSLTVRSRETTWCGNWLIEDTQGAITLIDDQITLIQNQQSIPINDFTDTSFPDCLDEFLASLRENRCAETSGQDNIRTQALVYFALASSRANSPVNIDLPRIGTSNH